VTYTETKILVGEGTVGYDCYVRLVAVREYNQSPGFCKMKSDTKTISTNLVNSGALDQPNCQELCDSKPDQCKAY